MERPISLASSFACQAPEMTTAGRVRTGTGEFRATKEGPIASQLGEFGVKSGVKTERECL